MVTLEIRRLRGRIYRNFQYLKGVYKKPEEVLLTRPGVIEQGGMALN